MHIYSQLIQASIETVDTLPSGSQPDGRVVKKGSTLWTYNATTSLWEAEGGNVGEVKSFIDAVTPDPDVYALMDGSTLNDPLSPIDGITLDDMSGLAPTGAGTLGGGNIGSSPTGVEVGNANNETSVTIPGHYHGKGDLRIDWSGTHDHREYTGENGNPGERVRVKAFPSYGKGMDTSDNGGSFSVYTGSAYHDHDSDDFSGSVGDTTGSNGDTDIAVTKNIQTRSRTFRFYMKKR